MVAIATWWNRPLAIVLAGLALVGQIYARRLWNRFLYWASVRRPNRLLQHKIDALDAQIHYLQEGTPPAGE
jgi:hypothetical protein